MVEAERPAQIRLRIDDLHDKQIATGVNGLGYMRARQASASGSRFMNSLTTQLHVPPDQARDVAEALVGGHFVDPLGGKYELLEEGERASARGDNAEVLPAPGARRLWASTAVTPQNRFLLTEIPADYQMPLMEWFRGLTLEVARVDSADALTLHAELDMVHQDVAPPAANEGGFKLPSLGGLFGLGARKRSLKPPGRQRQYEVRRAESQSGLSFNTPHRVCPPTREVAFADPLARRTQRRFSSRTRRYMPRDRPSRPSACGS